MNQIKNGIKNLIKKRIALSLLVTLGWFGHTQAQEIEPRELIIDSVECDGNSLTSCEIIQREINLGPGDQLDEDEMKNAKIRLQLLGLFKGVDLFLEKGQTRGHVIVKIRVIEGNPFFTETSLTGYLGTNLNSPSTAIGFKVGHRNLFGRGKVFQMTLNPYILGLQFGRGFPGGIQYSDRNNFSGWAEYSDPHFLGLKKYFLNVKAYYSQFEYISSSGRPIKNNELQTRINFGRRIFDFSYFGVGLINDDFRRTAAEEDGGSSTGNSRPTYTLSSGWNNEDDPYFPTEGGVYDLTYYHSLFDQGGKEITFWWTSLTVKQNIEIANKQNLSLRGGYTYHATNEAIGESWSASLGPEWSYQYLRAKTEGSITDARFFINPMVWASKEGPTNHRIDAGALLNTRDYGILRLTASYWGGSL